MKKYFFFLLSSIIISFSSCELTNEANYKPDIIFLQNPVREITDTLNIYYSDQSNVYRLDTLHVGDTVKFIMYITGYANNLTKFTLTQSADSVTEIILPDPEALDSIFLSTSNFKQGIFNMDRQATVLYFPFKYIAKKPSLEAKITFGVESDATFEFNQNGFVLMTPIIPSVQL